MHTWLRAVAVLNLGCAVLAHPVGTGGKPAAIREAVIEKPSVAREAVLEKPAVEGEEAPRLSGPITLSDAVRIAVLRHPSVEAMHAAARSAAEQVRALRSTRTLGISAASVASHSSAPIGFATPSPTPLVGPTGISPFNYGWVMPPQFSSYNQGLLVTLPLYDGGRSKAEIRSAVARREAAESEAVTTEQEIAMKTKAAYFAVLFAQAIADVQQNQMREVEARMKVIEERYRTDGVALYEVLRHQAELANVRQQNLNAQRDLAVALLDLKTCLGQPLEADITPADPLEFHPVEGTLDDQMAVAQRQSPELAAAEARCKAADQSLKAARRASYPAIVATAVGAGVAIQDAPGLTGSAYGVSMYLPIFDGGLRRANSEAAKARVAEEKATCSDMKLKVKRDVAAAWLDLQTASENVSVSETAISQADEAYRALQLRYDARRAIQAELLDALGALTRARLNRVQALYDYNIARARLDRAVGRV
jgi:outer membrane protein